MIVEESWNWVLFWMPPLWCMWGDMHFWNNVDLHMHWLKLVLNLRLLHWCHWNNTIFFVQNYRCRHNSVLHLGYPHALILIRGHIYVYWDYYNSLLPFISIPPFPFSDNPFFLLRLINNLWLVVLLLYYRCYQCSRDFWTQFSFIF